MKIKSVFAIAAMASLYVSCMQEEFTFSEPHTGKVIAIMENTAQTRTNVTEQGYFTWVAGDQISIHTNDGFILGNLNEGNGTPQGTFTYSYTGTAPTLTGYAVYPYSAKHAISDNELTFVMPSEYNLGTNTSNTNVAMLACPGEAKGLSQSFSFSHLAGAFRISFKNAPVGASKLEFTLGGKKINGTFNVNLEEPAINTADTETEAEKTTTLNFTPLAVAQDLVLYVPAPVGEYVGINAKLYKEDGTLLGEWGKATTAVTVNKRSLKLMTEINFGGVSGDIENNQQVATEAQLKAAVVNGGTITLTENITLAETVAISKDVTLNLNGYSIDASSIVGRPFDMQNGSSLIINGGTSEVKVGKYGLVNIPIGNTVSLTLNGGVYLGNTDNGSFIKVRGTKEVEETNEVNITLTNVQYTDASSDGYILNTDQFDGTCKVTVAGGTYSAAGGFQGMTTGSSVSGATITSTSDVTNPAMFAVEFEGGNSSIENCTVNAKYIAISTGYEGTATVKNCIVASDTYAYAIFPTGGNINITGGSYTGDLYIHDLNEGAPASKITVDGEVLAKSN